MEFAFVLIQIPAALMVLYLVILSGAAVVWRDRPVTASPHSRFALLVPAHNEEVLLPRLLDSISCLDYPHHLFDVHVVADNCTDETASRAWATGVAVHERQDETLRGKGYALRWLLERVRRSGVPYDAYVIFDADSVVSTNFLAVMNQHLLRGDRAIQSYYGVLNFRESWTSGLRYAALALFNSLRPRGRDVLHLSAGLRGNGMCFASTIVDRFGWEAFTLAEDAEFHLNLVEAGLRVHYAGGAHVLAEMPVTLAGARTQNVRWERGRLQMLTTYGPRLVSRGLSGRDPRMLDAVAEQLVPPLSVLTGVNVLSLITAMVLRMSGPIWLASMVLLGEVAYVAVGLKSVGAKPRAYLAFLAAPLYIAWKLWIYAVAAAHLRESRWIRTARSPQDI